MEHHLAERAERLIEEGWDPEEARAEAERRFGDFDGYHHETAEIARDVTWRRGAVERLGDVARDVRQTLRGVRRRPAFALTLIVTLALGIGGITSIFAVLDAVMLRPLPYDDPDELVSVSLAQPGGISISFLPVDQVGVWKEGMQEVLEISGSERLQLVRTDGEPEALAALAVGHDLDDLLGVAPRIGRAFGPDDAVAGAPRVAMLTHAYWARTGADPGVLGTTLRLEDEPWTVVGVLPRDFKYPVAGTIDLWVPRWTDDTAGGHAIDRTDLVGRLREGVTIDIAQERAEVLGAALAESDPTPLGWDVRLRSVGEWRGNSDLREALWMLGAAGGLMLLIALANAANLMLLKAHESAGDVAVRRAIGASRGRVLQSVLTESVLLSVVAGAAAALVAAAAMQGIQRIIPDDFAFSAVYPFMVERRAVAFAFALGVGGGLLGGLVPALWSATVRTQGAGGVAWERSRGRERARVRKGLVVAEVALSVTLLVGASLFVRSFATLLDADPGFDVESLAFLEIALSRRVYPEGADRREFTDRLLEEVGSLPGVEAVVAAQGLPPGGGGILFSEALEAEGRAPMEGFQVLPVAWGPPGYLEALGVRLYAGRGLRSEDVGTDNVVVDRDLATSLFGDGPHVGARFRLGPEDEWFTVVGVVEELKLGGADDQTGDWAIVRAQDPERVPSYVQLAVRTNDPTAILSPVRDAVRSLDAQQPIRELSTAERAMGESVARPRFLLVLMTTLASLALVLAAIGTFGVVAYSARSDRRSTGIRIALGASGREVRSRILRSGLFLAAAGIAIGLGLAMGVARFAEDMLYEVEPLDPTAFALAGLTMLVAAGVACWIPARWASRVDPIEVLNAE